MKEYRTTNNLSTSVIYSETLDVSWQDKIVVLREGELLYQFLVFVNQMPKMVKLQIHLAGRGSRAEIIIAYLGKNKDNTEISVTLIHDAPDTYGRVTAKAALFGESRFVLNGLLEITPNGKGSDSYLLVKALLLSPKARAEIYPYLEIKTDEIKASHGSSVGRIDENQLFYLQSRGVSREEAEKIILSGFFGDFASYLRLKENPLL